MNAQGLDVAHYQGSVDWKKVAHSGRHFVMPAMSGWGLRNRDPYWGRQRAREILDARLVLFPYYFGLPDEDPRESARYAVELARSAGWAPHRGGWRHDLCGPIMLDLEVNRGLGGHELQHWGNVFCMEVHRLTGRGCLDYSYGGFKREYGLRPFVEGGIYVHAEYGVSRPHIPPPFMAHFWQYNEHGYCPGVETECDLDVYFGNPHQLRQLARG